MDRSWILRRAAPVLSVPQAYQRSHGFCHLSREQWQSEDYLWIMILTLVLNPLNKLFQSCPPSVQLQPSFQIHMPCKQGSQSLHFWDKPSPSLGQESREVRAARDIEVEKSFCFQFIFGQCILERIYVLCIFL